MSKPRRVPNLKGDSVAIFREAVRAEETWLQYERRFVRFLQWLGFENNADTFLEKAKRDRKWAESKVIEYVSFQKARVGRGEISETTVANFRKPVKLFLEMNDVKLNWLKINKTLPAMRRHANDRAPTVEEIRKIISYPDMRVETIVLTMASSGIRVGAWDYLRLRDIKAIERDSNVIACRMRIYAGTPEEYVTFMTAEAYESLQRYLQYRELHGEQLTQDSPLLRNMFNTSQPIVNWKGEASNPEPLKHSGVKRLIERVLWRYGFRTEKKRRHEFAIDHGFRKFFKTRAEQVMKPINVEWLMGHSTGISDSYYRPTENELLDDYLKAAPLLTVSEVEEVRQKSEAEKKQLEERLNRIEASVSLLVSQKAEQLLSLAEIRRRDISR
jgi:hypothetical protein